MACELDADMNSHCLGAQESCSCPLEAALCPLILLYQPLKITFFQ